MKYLSVALPIPLFKNFCYSTRENVDVGCRVKVPFGKTYRIGYVLKIFSQAPAFDAPIKEVSEVIDTQSLITPQLIDLAEAMSRYYVSGIGEILSVILPGAIKSGKRKSAEDGERRPDVKLLVHSQPQNKTLKVMSDVIRSNRSGEFLLYSSTDSARTEIYMGLIEELVSLKKQVILLVPEIAVASQLVCRLEKMFGSGKLGVWHSRISPGVKMDYIRRMARGELDILIGPRSAVFAPFRNLGAIIIDEEQDPAYKEENSPYYDARWVAQKRCEIENGLLVLGSAAPRVETLWRADKGEINYIEVSGEISHSESPQITVVDMKREYEERRRGGIFSKFLLDELEATLQRKGQSILLLNRRGFSPYVVCKNCGENIRCANCNISLVYHSVAQKLSCHWCGATHEVPQKCPNCQGAVFSYTGIGTERVESALNKIFPDSKVARLDMDTVSKKAGQEEIFRKFQHGKYDIIVGTQMVAKGWDFSGTELVGVISSDTSLMKPDFRAAEKTYALLKQLEARVGTGSKIVIQTFNPGHYAVRMLLERDYRKFYVQELDMRKETGFPPFSKLINIISSHRNEDTAKKNMFYCRKFIEEKMKGAYILGPSPAPRYKMRGKYRWQILLKHHDEEKTKKILQEMMESRSFSGKLKIDVDPQEML